VLVIPSLCSDLSPVRVEHAGLFAEATHADRKGWSYYFPHTYLNGITGRNWIYLFEQVAGSVLLYDLRERRHGLELSLVVPPFPFTDEAMRQAEERLRAFNGPRGWRIRSVQESDALMLARRNLSITFKESEYIFDRAAVLAAEGSEFRSLRQELSRARNAGKVETRPYAIGDLPACRAILQQWKERLTENGMRANGYRCTVKCLELADSFAMPLLCGKVVEVDGEVRGFGFSGRLNEIYGCNFICITDTSFRGLPQILRVSLMTEFPELPYFNDATDSDRPGLRELKLRFRPVEMHHVYQADSN
jgi:hypothetical protein